MAKPNKTDALHNMCAFLEDYEIAENFPQLVPIMMEALDTMWDRVTMVPTINTGHVQKRAEKKLGRQLDYREMMQMKILLSEFNFDRQIDAKLTLLMQGKEK